MPSTQVVAVRFCSSPTGSSTSSVSISRHNQGGVASSDLSALHYKYWLGSNSNTSSPAEAMAKSKKDDGYRFSVLPQQNEDLELASFTLVGDWKEWG